MREILFRAYDKGRKEYLSDGYLFIAINKSRNPNKSEIYLDEISNADKYTERFVIEQYTGLTDKNGTKIFEGDIVKADDYIFVVKFGKCGGVANTGNYGYMGFYLEAFSESTRLHAKYGLRDDICYFTDIEVIGNVHDNSELFK